MFLSSLVLLVAAILPSQCGPGDGQCVSQLLEVGASKVDLQEHVDSSSAGLVCSQRRLTLLTSFDKLNDAERAFCGDRLVPFQPRTSNWKTLKISYDGTDPNPIDGQLWPAAVNLTSGRWQYVDESHRFDCVLCRHEKGVSLPLLDTSDHLEDRTTSAKFQVRLITPEARATAEVTEETKDFLSKELLRLLKPASLDSIKFNGASLDHQLSLQIEFRVDSPISFEVATDAFGSHILNGSYNMHVDDVGFCPSGTTYDVNDTATFWPKMVVGIGDVFSFSRDALTGKITRRDCHFDETLFRSDWDPQLTRWELQWEPCKSPDAQELNEVHYLQVLAPDAKLRHDNAMHYFVAKPVYSGTILDANHVVTKMLQVENRLPAQIISDIAKITAKLVMSINEYNAWHDYSYLIVADLNGLDDPLGFTLSPGYQDDFNNIIMNRKSSSLGRTLFAFDVSPEMTKAHTRITFLVAWMDVPLAWAAGEDNRACQYPEVTVMFPRQAEVTAETVRYYANHHVNITYESSAFMGTSCTKYFNYLVCVAWNYYSLEWDTRGCVLLNPALANVSTCVCSGEYFDYNEQDRIPVAKYALKKGMAADKTAIHNNIKI